MSSILRRQHPRPRIVPTKAEAALMARMQGTPATTSRPAAKPLPEARQDISAFLRRVGAKCVPGDHAIYLQGDQGTDEIQMPPFASFTDADHYHRVLLHELIHWTAPRVQRHTFGTTHGDDLNTEEELTCEMGSAILCAHFGIDQVAHHAEYLDSWLRRFPNKTERLVRAAQQAHRAVRYLFSLKV
jgi:antirestriction protein ArdC